MSFADVLSRSERSPLVDFRHSQYGGMHSDQVDRVATGDSGRSILDRLPETGRLSDFIPQGKAITVAESIDLSPEPVQQEASKVSWYAKVNWFIAVPLLFLAIIPGLIYIYCVTRLDAEPEISQTGEVRAPTRAPAQSTKAAKKKPEPTFEPKETGFYSPLHATSRDVSRFQDNKGSLEAEAQSLVRLKNQLQQEQRGLEELIPTVKAMSFIERKRAGHPPSKELQARSDQITEEIAGVNRRAREISDELMTDCMQHPQFREVAHSHKGFPFRIYFGAEELRQGISYDRYALPRNDRSFQVNINKQLAYWDGATDIDPFGTGRVALAQGVLVGLSNRPDEPLTGLSWSERRLNPQTVDRTLQVRFQRDGTMLIERQVETNDGKRFQWNETVRFEDGSAIISRDVREIRG